MGYLLHILFDNSHRLCRNIYYFEYKSIRYKLIQNNIRKWCDVLLTIIPDASDKKAQNQAYIVASEFLSALSWQNGSMVKVHPAGGPSVPDNYRLRNVKCCCFDFPKVPFSGHMVGYDICKIPQIETEEQRTALVLFREALSSNNEYLAFFFFWQVLEIIKVDKIGWINRAYKRNRNEIRLTDDEINVLPLKGKTLGGYLNDCRNTIAHIVGKKAGKTILKLDNPEDNYRIHRSVNVIREFASFYIKDKLKLQKEMYLVRKSSKSFPMFVDEEYTRTYPYPIAYRITFPQQKRKKNSI